MAISFFAFEFIHYLIDVLHGKPPIRNPIDFSLFATFFPTVVAGPIKRFEQFVPSLASVVESANLKNITNGFIRIILGLFKKLVLADFLAGYIDTWQPHFSELPAVARWQIFLALGFRILFDFSGYSDIAIGLAGMMGIKVPENFNWPYLSTSIQEFWRRWHISLSSWIRDYVYIPLGGSKQGVSRRATNALVAFALCGLWHGASWHYVFWGVYHGLGLIVATSYATAFGMVGRASNYLLSRFEVLKWLLTQIFVFVGWLYFFYPFNEATSMLKLLIGVNSA